jgi:hypothetical protein
MREGTSQRNNIDSNEVIIQDVQLKIGPYFNMRNLFTKI